jgi:hypothetical protein
VLEEKSARGDEPEISLKRGHSLVFRSTTSVNSSRFEHNGLTRVGKRSLCRMGTPAFESMLASDIKGQQDNTLVLDRRDISVRSELSDLANWPVGSYPRSGPKFGIIVLDDPL